MTEKPGRLRVVAKHAREAATVAGLPSVTNLLEVVVDPAHAENSHIYLSFTRIEPGDSQAIGLEVLRAELREMRLVHPLIVFKAQPKLTGLLHFGGRMLFLRDGTLLVTIGDGTLAGDRAQDSTTHLGAVVRIHSDGTTPSDNPSFSSPSARAGLFTIGHRNSQGIALRANGEIWSHEHGPIGGDEINILVPGANYGWPVQTSGKRHLPLSSAADPRVEIKSPILAWSNTIAPSGMTFYEADAFPDWKGSLLIGSLAHRALLRLSLKGSAPLVEEYLLADRRQRIRDVRVHQDGSIYVLTDSAHGELLQIKPGK